MHELRGIERTSARDSECKGNGGEDAAMIESERSKAK